MNDPGTGLVYMQQRYYDPVVGRFISPDPVGPKPGNVFNFNRYAYANDNPLRYTDPDGRCIDGMTCGRIFRPHVKWRLSHPNAPRDVLEKGAIVVAGAMATATGVNEAGSVATLLRTVARVVVRKVIKPANEGGLEGRGVRAEAGTRVRPDGVPHNWRIGSSKSKGGVKYTDPKNPHNSVRVEQSIPDSPYPNSRVPHVREVRSGRYVDEHGNPVTRKDPSGHIPLIKYHGRHRIH